jgi:transposase InsO family protein
VCGDFTAVRQDAPQRDQVFTLNRFARPGVCATGDRTVRNHVAIDDHSRLAFAALLPDEKIPSVREALHQAVDFYKAHGIRIQRLLTDRGFTYRSKLFASACQQLGLKHRFTKPYRPQTNGKAERFIQTITREWADARSYNSSDHRASFLPHFLCDYNYCRPHSALNSLPPIFQIITNCGRRVEVQQLGARLPNVRQQSLNSSLIL